MHPLQGASFLSTPLQGGILKPPALRVVADFSILVTLKLQLFDEVSHAILELDRLGFEHRIVIGILVPLGLLLHFEQLGCDGAAVFLSLRQDGLNGAHLFRVAELLAKGDRFDFR